MADPVEIHWGMWKQYPALTVGFPIFTFILVILDKFAGGGISNLLVLIPSVGPLLDLLNRLLFFQCVHKGLGHWLCNMFGLFTPMMLFERRNGTVFTGITLNLLAMFTGILYWLIGQVFYRNVGVLGSLGYVFSFFTYTCWQESQFIPVFRNFVVGHTNVEIPTALLPVIVLVVWTIISWVLDLNSSFMGHALATGLGYALAMGHIKKAYPPLKVVLFIESKVGRGIDMLAPLVTYYREDVSVEDRGRTYTPIFAVDIEATPQLFSESRVLGTA